MYTKKLLISSHLCIFIWGMRYPQLCTNFYYGQHSGHNTFSYNSLHWNAEEIVTKEGSKVG